MTMITPSSELTLTKGTSPAGLNEFALALDKLYSKRYKLEVFSQR